MDYLAGNVQLVIAIFEQFLFMKFRIYIYNLESGSYYELYKSIYSV